MSTCTGTCTVYLAITTCVYRSIHCNRTVEGRSIVVKVNHKLSNLDLRSVFICLICIQEVESSWRPGCACETQLMIGHCHVEL